MDNGELLAVGLHVHKLVVVAGAQGTDSVIILHPPMVVWIVKEEQFVDASVIRILVLVRNQFLIILTV